MISFAVISGGCGGSGGSIITDNGNSNDDNNGSNEDNFSFTNKAVLLGAMTSERLQEVAESNLYSYIDELITSRDNFDIESLNDGDILFIADASALFNNIDSSTQNKIISAYYDSGVIIAAVYPDSEDLKAMEDFFTLNLGRPVSFDGTPLPNSHYEFIALGWRQITDEGGSNTFVYAVDHRENLDELYGLGDEFVSGDLIIRRKDYSSYEDYALAILKNFDMTDAEIQEFTKIFAELAADTLETYIINLFTWAAELDQKAIDIKEDFTADVAKLKAQIAADNDPKKEIMTLAAGLSTNLCDPIHREFCDYYREFGINANNSSFKEFIRRNGFSSYERLLKYWSVDGSRNKTDGKPIYVRHETDADYRITSLHYFDNKKDYYIVTTNTMTRPVNLEICAPKGDKTRDELEGGDPGLSYHYDLIFGGNRGLSARVWTSIPEATLEKYLPNRTANKETQVTDTSGWNLGGGVSVGGGGGANKNGGQTTGMGQGNLEASFNWGIRHSTTKTWGVNDYEIIPNYHYENGLQVVQWDAICTWPEYSKSSDSWERISNAFKENLSFETESIWSIPAEKRAQTKLYGQSLFTLGFCWAHDMPAQSIKSYNAEVPHRGTTKELRFDPPPLLGIGSATTTGNKTARMYTAKVLCENDWEAKSDSDWLEVVHKSGRETGKEGTDFSYTVTENNTGQPRVGTITVTSGKYVAKIKFTQSPDAQ
ncbi:MAG: BACON domain-containing protein [Synergistaceae bacterium]|nr:BACON domain-containing protein [Synergistaceae bacterium]